MSAFIMLWASICSHSNCWAQLGPARTLRLANTKVKRKKKKTPER